MKSNVLLLRNKIRLAKLIENNESKAKIVAQSKRLDEYVTKVFKERNQINP